MLEAPLPASLAAVTGHFGFENWWLRVMTKTWGSLQSSKKDGTAIIEGRHIYQCVHVIFNTRGKTERAPWLGLTSPENAFNCSSIILQRVAFSCDLAVFEFYLREQLHGVRMCGPVPRAV